MPKLIANILATVKSEDDRILLKACIDSIYPVVDKILILASKDEHFDEWAHLDKVSVFWRDPDFIEKNGFAAARNELLAKVPIDDFVLWIDSDEVAFPEQLKHLYDLLQSDSVFLDGITTHFIHFCLGSNAYERFERRLNIFKNHAALRWVGKTHEKLNRPPYSVFHSDYIYHHYGYVRDQAYVFSRWRQYALLEGQENPYHVEEVDGEILPYFRDERDGPDKILEDRKKTLLPYFGAYPSVLPESWIRSKLIDL